MSREDELIAVLKNDYITKGIAVSPGQFALDQGFAHRNGVQRYKRLRAMLHDWAAKSHVREVRGQQRPRLFDADRDTQQALEKTLEGIDRLRSNLKKSEARVKELSLELDEAESRVGRLRGVVSSLLTHFSHQDPTLARRLDRKVIEWAGRSLDPEPTGGVIPLRSEEGQA